MAVGDNIDPNYMEVRQHELNRCLYQGYQTKQQTLLHRKGKTQQQGQGQSKPGQQDYRLWHLLLAKYRQP